MHGIHPAQVRIAVVFDPMISEEERMNINEDLTARLEGTPFVLQRGNFVVNGGIVYLGERSKSALIRKV